MRIKSKEVIKIKQAKSYDGIDKEALNSVYMDILTALNGDEAGLMKIFRQLSGQQINLPVHLYSPEAMKLILKDKYEHGGININLESERYGYTRRWILGVIKQIRAGKI